VLHDSLPFPLADGSRGIGSDKCRRCSPLPSALSGLDEYMTQSSSKVSLILRFGNQTVDFRSRKARISVSFKSGGWSERLQWRISLETLSQLGNDLGSGKSSHEHEDT